MPRFPQRIWLAAFFVAWVVDFLFWGKPAGISFLIFVVITLAAGFLLARFERARPVFLSFVLAAVVVVLTGATLVRVEPLSRLMNGALALVGLALLVRTFQTGGWIRFHVFSYILFWIDLFVIGLVRAAGLPFLPKEQKEGALRVGMRGAIPYVRGLFLALPVVILLAALLASADLVFADQVNAFLKIFDLARLPEYLLRFCLIVGMAYLFASFFLQAVKPAGWVINLPGDPQKADPAQLAPVNPAAEATGEGAHANLDASSTGMRFLGATEAFIVLGSVNLLFAFFVAIQFHYLFGGNANITAAGYTFSEYARRGFFELVSVAVITLFITLVLNAVTRRGTRQVEWVYILLSTLLVGQVLVILVSAFQRLLLYENAYGFTRLRVYTHIFIPWLGLLLVATILLQILRREQFFGAVLLAVVAGFSLSFAVLNIDGLIARQNVARAREGIDLDGAYLLSLSDDALHELVRGFGQPDQPEQIHEVLGGVLACREYQIAQEEPRPWQSFHPGSASARGLLANVDLSAYPVQFGTDGSYIRLKEGSFQCFLPRIID